MKHIGIKVLNPEAIADAERMMVCAARLTQRGHKIKNVEDFMKLYNSSYQEKTAATMTRLPHPTIQKFGVINVVVVGASRRFLAQITRHQNEVKFMSASLQYSDYSGEAGFVTPYSMLDTLQEFTYQEECKRAMDNYAELVDTCIDNDAAGYIAPQGLRNILIISATPYQWKHMIGQRVCRRNTDETRYVLLRIWEALYKINPILFSPETTGPDCLRGYCREGKMTCGKAIDKCLAPAGIIAADFPKLFWVKEETDEDKAD